MRIRSLFIFCPLAFFLAVCRSDAAQEALSPSDNTGEAQIELWNRVIAVQRGTLGGISAQERAQHASERLEALPLNTEITDIVLRPVEIDDQNAVVFHYRGEILFFVRSNDLDKESNQTLDQAAQVTLHNLDGALKARVAQRSWSVIRSGIFFTLTGLAVSVLLWFLIWRIHHVLTKFLRKHGEALSESLVVFGLNILPGLFAILRSVIRLVALILTFTIFYLWVALSLRRFPYTEPWGSQAGSFVVDLLRELMNRAVRALPGLVAVVVIFFVTRWFVKLLRGLFEQIATGRINISWMDADVARATQRIFAVVAYIFAIVMAYPYFPGSQTEAFKGITVLFGLVISLGSTGIINQIMSGLFVVYSKALKTGEWVKVSDTEGEVLDVGLLAAKVRTVEGQEVTIPNSLLVTMTTMNFTRLGLRDGMTASSTVTVGYEAPWRQVHALLLLAAERTENLRKTPAPYVLQRRLTDFYVEYTLIAHLQHAHLRIETLSELHSKIQDAFNEFGVQIMSPHYMTQPEKSLVVPQTKWHAPPSPSGS